MQIQKTHYKIISWVYTCISIQITLLYSFFFACSILCFSFMCAAQSSANFNFHVQPCDAQRQRKLPWSVYSVFIFMRPACVWHTSTDDAQEHLVLIQSTYHRAELCILTATLLLANRNVTPPSPQPPPVLAFKFKISIINSCLLNAVYLRLPGVFVRSGTVRVRIAKICSRASH